MTTHTYLVGVDGSEWGERAAERAVRIAKQTKANVHLVYVLDWSALQSNFVESIAPVEVNRQLEEASVMDNVLIPLKEKLSEHDVDISLTAEWGNPVETLHEYAKKERVNMIFVGRRGRSRFAGLLLGSVADKLAHHVGVPIVLVP